ncbi:hypothetical protein AcV5_006957 [Taiwanofungus camphoratus]|nr:hypothetical protein AcV5_006957 [Antrodia cinnamomea]
MKRSALSSRGDIPKAVDVELTGAVVVRLYRLNKRLPAPLLDRYVKRPSRARSKYKPKQSHYAHYGKKALPDARKRIERLHTVDILSDPFGTMIFNYQESALIVSGDHVFSGLTSMEKNRDQFNSIVKRRRSLSPPLAFLEPEGLPAYKKQKNDNVDRMIWREETRRLIAEGRIQAFQEAQKIYAKARHS